MNEEQVKSASRTIIASTGGIIIGWFASKGYHLSPEETKNVMALIQSPEFIGLVMSSGVAIWGHLTHSNRNAVAVADALPEVAGVIMRTTQEGRAITAEVPSNTVVSVGSSAAKDIAGRM